MRRWPTTSFLIVPIALLVMVGTETILERSREAHAVRHPVSAAVGSQSPRSTEGTTGPGGTGWRRGEPPLARRGPRFDWRAAGDPRAYLLLTGALAHPYGWIGPHSPNGCVSCWFPAPRQGVSGAVLDRSQ